jgi:hypothetical protein
MCFDFLYDFCLKHLILTEIQRDAIINVYKSSCKVPTIRVRLELEFSRQIFEKYLNIKFHENPSSRGRIVACGRRDGQTDRQTTMTTLIIAFRNFANTPKMHLKRKALTLIPT